MSPEVLAYRQLGFGLREIANLVDDPATDAVAQLRRLRGLLLPQRDRAAAMVTAIDRELEADFGAGTGSYEPFDRELTAVEPSAVMRAQRPTGAAPCVAAGAESLSFEDQSVGGLNATGTSSFSTRRSSAFGYS
jgi:hypothetical protein